MAEDRSLQVTPPDLALSLAQHQASVATKMGRIEEHPDWKMLATIPIRVSAGFPILRFRVRDLLQLTVGHVVESSWTSGADVPLSGGGVQLGWAECEVLDKKLAMRMTRLV